jgi:hypothetical protein
MPANPKKKEPRNLGTRNHETNFRGGGEPFTSSLNTCQEAAVERGDAPHLTTTVFMEDSLEQPRERIPPFPLMRGQN